MYRSKNAFTTALRKILKLGVTNPEKVKNLNHVSQKNKKKPIMLLKKSIGALVMILPSSRDKFL